MSGIVADMVLTRVDMTPWNVGAGNAQGETANRDMPNRSDRRSDEAHKRCVSYFCGCIFNYVPSGNFSKICCIPSSGEVVRNHK